MRILFHECLIIWFLFLLLMIQTKRPLTKRHLAVWQLECELGIITDPDCPVDGGWSPWSAWSSCHGRCDDVGYRRRTRDCTNPPPSKDGDPCTGPEDQTELCYLPNCTAADFEKLISGESTRMKALRHLEAVPALMEQCLQMECSFEAIEAALAIDNTWQLDAESLWNSLQCVRRNLGCPITGEWGAWSAWSACGARCGLGLVWRVRKCDTPPPSEANLVCTGSPLQADECIGDECAINSRDSGGSWGEWSRWSPCSEKCGTGIKRRRRICMETTKRHISGTWGTHCRGPHDQLEVCENHECVLDGGWSGWGVWGPCSQDCGAGKRFRTRSCTRPIPTGLGKGCVGSKTEVGSCHLKPCEGFSHQIAFFQGESLLHYDFYNRRAALCHFYARFLPLSSHGTIMRRSAGESSHIRLSLQKWHVCLDACNSDRSCCLPRSCSHSSLEPAVWHTVLIAVTNEGAVLRLDDGPAELKTSWPCNPELPDDYLRVYVGERFQGQIQELIFNFIPLKLTINTKRKAIAADFYPITASNVAYQKSVSSEAYINLSNDHYLRLPCFTNQSVWQVELTLKPAKETGTILYLSSDKNYNWLHLDMQNMRLKLKLAVGRFRSESISTSEYPPDKWIDVKLTKKQEINAIEACINAGERIHVIFEEEVGRRQLESQIDTSKELENTSGSNLTENIALCSDEFFIGGVPNEIKRFVSQEDFTPFSVVLASVKVNNVFLDLLVYSMERYTDNTLQVSSRTASVSGFYHETSWGKSNRLNLTCLHARKVRTDDTASWLFLDTTVTSALREKPLQSIDDGRVLRLVASADNDLRGFYTCRAHSNRQTENVVTYGVLGKTTYKLRDPNKTTALAVITTLSLVLGTLIWLFIEGIHDLRNGYGFFRDAHFKPQEEAEAVCKYIDQNVNLIHSKRAGQIAKSKAKRRARQLAVSRSNFAAQEPQGLMNLNKPTRTQDYVVNPEQLPTVPEVRSSNAGPVHALYRLEPCYVSSPHQGFTSSPHRAMTSSSSFELVSPRVLCSKLMISKGLRSSRLHSSSRKESVCNSGFAQGRSITSAKTSSRPVNQKQPNPGQKILQRFQKLKSYNDYTS